MLVWVWQSWCRHYGILHPFKPSLLTKSSLSTIDYWPRPNSSHGFRHMPAWETWVRNAFLSNEMSVLQHGVTWLINIRTLHWLTRWCIPVQKPTNMSTETDIHQNNDDVIRNSESSAGDPGSWDSDRAVWMRSPSGAAGDSVTYLVTVNRTTDHGGLDFVMRERRVNSKWSHNSIQDGT